MGNRSLRLYANEFHPAIEADGIALDVTPVVGVDRPAYVARLSSQEVLHPLAHPEALREALTALLFVSRGGKRYRQKRLASRLE